MGTSINPPPTPEDQYPATDNPTNENDLNNDDEIDGLVELPDHEDILDSTGRIQVNPSCSLWQEGSRQGLEESPPFMYGAPELQFMPG